MADILQSGASNLMTRNRDMGDGTYAPVVYIGGSQSAVTYTDASGTISTANTSQQVAPANASRRAFIFQNASAGDLYLNFGAAAAVSGGLKVAAGQSYESQPTSVPAGTINVFGATAGAAYTAKVG